MKLTATTALSSTVYGEDGAYFRDYYSKDEVKTKQLTNWVINFDEQIIVNDHLGKETKLVGELCVQGHVPIRIECSPEELSDTRGPLRIAARFGSIVARCTDDRFASEIRDAIAAGSRPKIINAYRTMGYVEPGVFLAGKDLAIRGGEFLNPADLGIAYQPNQKDPSLCRFGLLRINEGEAHDLALHVVNDWLRVSGPHIMMPLLGQIFAAPLMSLEEIASGYGLVTLWLHGSSGSGKSERLREAACFFGRFPTRESLFNVSSTANYLELAGHYCPSAVFPIDNVSRTNLTGKAWASFEHLIQDAYDRGGRGRMTAGIDFREAFPVRGLPIISAEDLPESPAVVGRSLLLDVSQPQNSEEAYKRSLARCCDYSGLTAHYIAYVQRTYPPDKLRTRLDQISKKIKQSISTSESDDGTANTFRIFQNATVNRIGVEMFVEFVESLGIDAQWILDEHAKVLAGLIEKTQLMAREERPADKFLAILSELISSGRAHIYRGKCSPEGGEMDRSVGFTHINEVAVFGNVAFNIVNKHYRDLTGRPFPHSTRAIGQQLKDTGLLVRCDVGRSSTSIWFGGKNHRVWLIDRGALGFRYE